MLNYFDSLYVSFERPLTDWNIDSMAFIKSGDTISMRDMIESGLAEFDIPINVKKGTTAEVRLAMFNYDWEPNTNYGFIFNAGAFTDILGETNDSLSLIFRTIEFDQYGSLRFTVKVQGYDGLIILEQLDNSNNIVDTYHLHSGDEIYHKLAVPGVFRMRAIIDENENGKWDTGDIENGIQPEIVIYYTDKFTIRANWDIEEIWNINIKK